MILGIGCDIVSLDRIKALLTHSQERKKRFLDRCFSNREQSYFLERKEPLATIAGRFAAKEAIAKALQCGFGKHLSWLDLEVLAKETGAPYVVYSTNVQERFHAPNILISISHDPQYAISYAMWVTEKLS